MRRDKTETAILVLTFAFPFLLIALGLAQPYFEAQSFNRCTGSHATYWDALFLQLRVENCK